MKISRAELSRRAEAAVERILAGYTDFQVDTIDSFAAMVFRASAVDLGYGPDFEISLDLRELLDYAFARFLRRVKPASAEGETFRRILDYLLLQEGEKSRFLWDPTPKIGEKLNAFLEKLAGRPGDLVLDDFRKEKAALQKKIRATNERLKRWVEASGLDVTAPGALRRENSIRRSRTERFADLIECSFKTFPVKTSAKSERRSGGGDRKRSGRMDEPQSPGRRDTPVGTPGIFSCRICGLIKSVQAEMSSAKRSRGLLFLDDVNRELHRYLDRGIVPDVYFRLGDRIYHYLIDEFQDTSPIQWKILKPLIEESLGRGRQPLPRRRHQAGDLRLSRRRLPDHAGPGGRPGRFRLGGNDGRRAWT